MYLSLTTQPTKEQIERRAAVAVLKQAGVKGSKLCSMGHEALMRSIRDRGLLSAFHAKQQELQTA